MGFSVGRESTGWVLTGEKGRVAVSCVLCIPCGTISLSKFQSLSLKFPLSHLAGSLPNVYEMFTCPLFFWIHLPFSHLFPYEMIWLLSCQVPHARSAWKGCAANVSVTCPASPSGSLPWRIAYLFRGAMWWADWTHQEVAAGLESSLERLLKMQHSGWLSWMLLIPVGTRNVLGNDPKTNLRMSFRDVFCQSWKRQVGRDKERQILALELDSGRRKESAERGKLEVICCESPCIDRFHSPGGKKIIKQI